MGSAVLNQITSHVFNDPIHNTIEIHPLCLKIIDTPEFQRLRYLKQCGVCYLVYPSAVHTRFEHCIGVYHLAGKMLEQLKKKNKIKISEEECLCVRIAALLHDIGHGPFSHLWESFVNMRSSEINTGSSEIKISKYHHEEMSELLFDRLIDKNQLSKDFEKYNLKKEHTDLIKNIISGDPTKIEDSKLFLLEIVANKITNLDVDRWDYMLRDSYFFGVRCSVNLDRMITHAEICKVSGKNRIAFRDKIERDLFETFAFRMKLHEICYQHRVCKNVELMLLDALSLADDYFFEDDEKMKLSNCHNNKDVFISLNDELMNRILYSKNAKLNKARNILKRIESRDLYDFVEEIELENDLEDFEQTLKDIESCLNEQHKYDCRLALLDINMGSGKFGPLERVPLFSKIGDVVYNPKKRIRQRTLHILVFCVKKLDDGTKEKIIHNIRSEVEIRETKRRRNVEMLVTNDNNNEE